MLDAAHYAKLAPHIPDDRAAERAPSTPHLWTAPVPYNPHAGVALKADVDAYINEGRWIAECPDCHGAQLTSQTDPRFMCVNCGNQAVGGQWRQVRWPKDVPGIERALEVRAVVHQHWTPGESVADLKAETRANA